MNLKKSRDEMRESFESGHVPALLEKYKKERNSEDWRTSKIVEELCEYALFLVDKHIAVD